MDDNVVKIKEEEEIVEEEDEVMMIQPYRTPGVYLAKGRTFDALVTKNLVSGENIYTEKLISGEKNGKKSNTEYGIFSSQNLLLQ